MEKIWKPATISEYKRCFDILNTQSLIETETYKNFAIELFEIAKRQLGCTDCKLKFINDERNNLGFASTMDNSVTLNLNKMEKQTLYKTVSTIYHELTHIRQGRVDEKKKINQQTPAKFPFLRCYGDERFLPAEILGISPFLFYYTCQHEKQARDVGNECSMELFKALQNIAQTTPTRTGTSRHIDRCIMQTQTRWDKENSDNNTATAQINLFLKQRPNFTQEAFEKIKTEFLTESKKYAISSRERFECENKFNRRIGSLVLLGCDENLKQQILSFVSSNFLYKGEIFNTLISITDSPYSKTTKNDFVMLFKLAELNNCPKQTLYDLLISWDNNYIDQIMNPTTAQEPKPFKINNFEF